MPKQIEEYYQLILAMPFVKELAEGSLKRKIPVLYGSGLIIS